MPPKKEAPILRGNARQKPIADALVQVIDAPGALKPGGEQGIVKMAQLATLCMAWGDLESVSARSIGGILDALGIYRHPIQSWTTARALNQKRDDIAIFAGVPTRAQLEAEEARIAEIAKTREMDESGSGSDPIKSVPRLFGP